MFENPFERARSGIAQLSELAGLQRKQSDAQILVTRRTDELGALLRRIATVNVEGIDASVLLALFSERDGQARHWWDELDVPAAQDDEALPLSPWRVSESLAAHVEAMDGVIRQQNSDRAVLVEEQARLRTFHSSANSIATLRAQHILDLERSGTNIDNFNATNERLIQEVEKERLKIAEHRPINAAYGQFRARLLRYREDLPRALTANLSQTTKDLFNAFNRDDVEGNRLAQLVLPVNATQTIKIAFNSHPTELHDALHILSEGHIRCLGLAMLVAKNIQENCPVLIFDDAVNAIDHDHRSGIGATLFDNQALVGKQIIITCHGEEMIKDVENILDHQLARAECLSYTFLPHDGNRVIRVLQGQTRNYILEAQQALATGRIRAALGHARRATEAVTAKTWKFFERQNQGELRLKMDRLRAPIELNDLANQLKKKIDSPDFQHVRKQRLSEGYVAMLDQRAWAVINAGTHEEAGRPDFPREVVLAVVNNLAILDEVLAGRHDR